MSNGPASIFSRLKRWHIAAIAFVILVAAAVAIVLTINPFGLNPFTGEDESALAPTERLLPVRIDTLTTEIAINGSIAFSNKEDLTFGSPGYISEVLVTEGEIVTEGQPLASLDPESVANLRRAIAQAQLGYEDALGTLEDARQPTLQIAEAEAALAEAALQVENVREALDALLNPAADTVAQAESAVADAELEVQNAREALDELVNPPVEILAAAEDDIAQARVDLRDAELALTNDVAAANDNLKIAERDLAVARQNLDALNDSNQLKSARDTHDDERQDYANVIYKWTGVRATDEDLSMTPGDLFAALDFIPELVYDRNYDLFPDGRIADNPDTRWNELKIFGWRALYPTSNLIEPQCDHYTYSLVRQSDTDSTNDEFCIQRDMRNAYDALVSARSDLMSTQAQYDDSLAAAKEALTDAEKARSDAQEALDRLTDGSIGAERLQAQFHKAQADYDAALRNLDELNNPDSVEVESRLKQLTLAQAKREAAAETLDALIKPDAEEVALKRNQFALAQAERDRTAQDLQKIHDRRELEVALQEASVAAAQAKIDGETRRYEDSTLKAPWNGYIASIPAEVGQEIEPFEVILTVINSGIVNIEGSVDEIDVLSLRREEPVIVEIDALPGQELEGVITNISSTSTNDQGVVTFDVVIKVNVPDGVALQEGLSAVARVAISEERGVVIPLQSVQYGEQGAFVRKENETGEIIEQPVSLGNGDGFFTLVESGLSEGDRIVMQVWSESELEVDVRFGPRGGRRGPPPEREFDE